MGNTSYELEEIFGFLHNIIRLTDPKIIQFFWAGFTKANRMNSGWQVSLWCNTLYDKNKMCPSFHSYIVFFFFYVTSTAFTYSQCWKHTRTQHDLGGGFTNCLLYKLCEIYKTYLLYKNHFEWFFCDNVIIINMQREPIYLSILCAHLLLLKCIDIV